MSGRHMVGGAVVLLCALGTGCGAGEEAPAPSDAEASLESQVEALAEAFGNLTEVLAETWVDGRGCVRRRWYPAQHFVLGESGGEAFGVPLVDTLQGSYQVSDPHHPLTLWLDLDEQGNHQLAGAGWLIDPDDASQTFLGIPLDDLPTEEVVPKRPGETGGLRLNAWLWITHPDHAHGWFGGPNRAMQPPSWWEEVRIPMLEAFSMHSPDARQLGGYTQTGACITGDDGDVGFPQFNPDLKGSLDPMGWDTVLLDSGGGLLGVQWTSPDDGSGPPTLLGQTFSGPDTNGDYVLRMWMGERLNVSGLFHPTLAGFSCDGPPAPSDDCR